MRGYAQRHVVRVMMGLSLLAAATAVSMAADEISSEGSGQATSWRSGSSLWHGPWDLTTPYRKDDMVIYDNTIFVANQDNFMVVPASNVSVWRQLTAKHRTSSDDVGELLSLL